MRCPIKERYMGCPIKERYMGCPNYNIIKYR